MLRAMDIRDMLLIDRLDLSFGPGLNVLTGETGAGKSILLDCLGFVLGWRGRAELVRAGAAQGEVTAVFDLPPGHPARAVLAEVAGAAAIAPELRLAMAAEYDALGDPAAAEQVLAKHDETYMPKEVADKMGAAHKKHGVDEAEKSDKPAAAGY